MDYLANIEGGEIVIRVPVEALSVAVPIALERAWGEHKLFVEDEAEFAKEMVLALNAENEIGDTPVHKMLDAVAVEAIGNGAFGIGESV